MSFFNKKNIISGYKYLSVYNSQNFKDQISLYNTDSHFSLLKNTNLSSVGFYKDWVSMSLHRGTESWGAGENIQLGINQNSDPYNYISLASNYGNLRVRYIHGFLERSDENINRYLTAKGIEWTNKKSLVIGFSESIIYSGYNRSFEIGYLNPLSFHLETELNNRLNITGNNNSNAIWQFHLDLFIIKKLRFSLNYLIDEFVLDRDIEIGKEHGSALSMRISTVLIKNEKLSQNIYLKIIKVGTPTFRHSNAQNNFVLNMSPLGWSEGSDIDYISVGSNILNFKNFMFGIEIGGKEIGSESILKRPYDPYKDYKKGSFPSGNTEKINFLKSYFECSINSLTSIYMNVNIENKLDQEIQIGFIRIIFNKKDLD